MADKSLPDNELCKHCGGPVKQSWRKFCSVLCAGKAQSPLSQGYAERFPNGKKRKALDHTRIDSITGYRMVRAPEGRSRTGWMREHTMIAEETLGRRLKRGEEVHHIDGDKTNNARTNLLICTSAYHRQLESRMAYEFQRRFLTVLSNG
jgi:hypothetical protein